jgi:hypothetical protein
VSDLLKAIESIRFDQGQVKELVDRLMEEDLFSEVHLSVLTIGARLQEYITEEVVCEQKVYLRAGEEEIDTGESIRQRCSSLFHL